jgi:uncharacterized repeat protein (TIGR03803 family)
MRLTFARLPTFVAVARGSMICLSRPSTPPLNLRLFDAFQPKAPSFSFDGTVFKLTPTKSGEWNETILHSFNCTEGNDDSDGCNPYSYLIFDRAGNLYGTTNRGGGGDFTTFCQNGCGTVFKLAPNSDGTWTESLIHTFPRGKGGTPDGQNRYAGLVIDSAGNLYGTTYIGGHDDAGLIFRLTPASDGKWKETVLFQFRATINNPKDGLAAYAGLAMDKSGNLYGTTRGGGGEVTGGGTVYKLTPTSKGEWSETVIHAFPAPRYHDGEFVLTGVTLDAAGNLYGSNHVRGRQAGVHLRRLRRLRDSLQIVSKLRWQLEGIHLACIS